MNDNYTVLHCHTQLSNATTTIDSITGVDDYIKRAVECDMKALCISEHGNLLSWLKRKEHIEAAGLKYIHGVEAYLTKNLNNKIRDNYHCLLLAKNYDGVKELNRLISNAYNRLDGHFYFAPRITLEELYNTSDNIICSSACLGGPLRSNDKEVVNSFINFMTEHKDRCYLEIQPHLVQKQYEYNQWLYRLHMKTGIPMVACTDTHSLNDRHALGREILQKAKNISFPDEDHWTLTWLTYNELVSQFEKQGSINMDAVKQAIENTNIIADMIEPFEVDHSNKYPKLYKDPMSVIKKKIAIGIKRRGVDKLPNYDEYKKRIIEELETYKHNDAIDFILLEEDYKSALKKSGVNFGYSRGSVSGSIICYLLGITEIDSIKFNLSFSRFMNKERVSLADIDSDWFDTDREKVRQYLVNKDGLYCSDIVTFNTIKTKGAIKDVGRALGMKPDQTQELSDAVEKDEKGNDIIPEYIRKKYPELCDYVDLVNGTTVSIGSHPAGLIVAPHTIDDHYGTITTATDPYPVTEMNMKELDSINLVKLDILGLDCVGLIDKTCKFVGLPFLTPDNTKLDDINVWNDIREDCTTIFQFESEYAGKYLQTVLSEETINNIRKVNPNFSYIELMAMANGAIRPAGESYRENLSHGIFKDNGNEELNAFLSDTLSYLVYQEQIIEFLNKFCGYSIGEADVVRRCVSENTMITMANGNIKAIKDVKKGEYVLTINENGYSECKRVNNVYNNGRKKCLLIKTTHDNTIICTKDHEVLTQNGFKPISSLDVGDCIMTPKRINAISDGLRPNQRMASETMFMLGILIGDGCTFCDTKNYSKHLTYVNHERALIQKYKECVSGLSRYGTKCEFSISKQSGVEVDYVYTVRIKTKSFKKMLFNLLNKLDMLHKSADKSVPDCIMSYPANEKLSNFIGGLFSSDGGYNSQALSIEYYTLSKKLATQIKYLLLKYDIFSYVYSKKVKKYNYLCYCVCISKKEHLYRFEKSILPYVVGKKQNDYIRIIDASRHVATYNYYIPEKYRNEILENAKLFNRSIASMAKDSGYDFEVKISSAQITDTKARYFAERTYCPETYQLLMSDYMPERIKSIEEYGIENVYDLEVDSNHNYIANNLFVHNCFAKKIGTEQHIPEIKRRFIETMVSQHNVTKEEAERVVIDFLRVIEDASNYLFSRNHAVPYALLGYVCGYLRYYYTLEYLTVAMNIYYTDEKKSVEIKKFANKKGITINNVKFGKSKSEYFMDKKTNSIYQGISSIKYCNEQIAEEFWDLSKNEYSSFIRLLKDISEKTSVDARQISILTIVGFFSEFGKNGKLLKLKDLYAKLGNRKSIKKSDLPSLGLQEKMVEKYSGKITEKTYSQIDNVGLLEEIAETIEDKAVPIKTQIMYEIENLGMANYVNPNIDPKYYMCTEFKTYKNSSRPYVVVRCLNTGEDIKTKIASSKIFQNSPFGLWSTLRIDAFTEKPKMRKQGDQWVETGEKELVISAYETIAR